MTAPLDEMAKLRTHIATSSLSNEQKRAFLRVVTISEEAEATLGHLHQLHAMRRKESDRAFKQGLGSVLISLCLIAFWLTVVA